MAILHTPRTIAAIARGILKRRSTLTAVPSTASVLPFVGVAPHGKKSDNNSDAHVYKSKLNVLFDADYLGHMNNASYLNHAEYARWQWTAENGTLQTMYKSGIHFVVTNTAIRFRKEISVRRRSFEIHTNLIAIDDRHLWMQHTFRSPTIHNQKGRIMAQVGVQAVAVQNRKVVNPSSLLEKIGVSSDDIDSLKWKDDSEETDISGYNSGSEDAITFLKQFQNLDDALRKDAAVDDKRIRSNSF